MMPELSQLRLDDPDFDLAHHLIDVRTAFGQSVLTLENSTRAVCRALAPAYHLALAYRTIDRVARMVDEELETAKRKDDDCFSRVLKLLLPETERSRDRSRYRKAFKVADEHAVEPHHFAEWVDMRGGLEKLRGYGKLSTEEAQEARRAETWKVTEQLISASSDKVPLQGFDAEQFRDGGITLVFFYREGNQLRPIGTLLDMKVQQQAVLSAQKVGMGPVHFQGMEVKSPAKVLMLPDYSRASDPDQQVAA